MKLVDKLIDESVPPDAPMWERLTEYGRGVVNEALENAAKQYRCHRKYLVWRIDKDGTIHVKKKSEVSCRRKKNSPTLSSIIPELAPYDTQPDVARFFTIVTQAKDAARYAAEKNFQSDLKQKLKSLFMTEHNVAALSMRDFLNDMPNLSQDVRNHWHRKWTALLERTRDLLFESLEIGVSNNSGFQDLVNELIQISQGLGFESGSWQHGKIDLSTRLLVTKKPAETEQKATPSPINIQNSNVILGNVHQPGNLQVGDRTQIQKITGIEKQKIGSVKKILKIIAAIVVFLAALFTCLGYLLGWLGPIKAFIYRIISPE